MRHRVVTLRMKSIVQLQISLACSYKVISGVFLLRVFPCICWSHLLYEENISVSFVLCICSSLVLHTYMKVMKGGMKAATQYSTKVVSILSTFVFVECLLCVSSFFF